jgi:hypothetical protein
MKDQTQLKSKAAVLEEWRSSDSPYVHEDDIYRAMEEYANQYKDRPTPPVETKTAEEIAKLDRCYNLLPCPFCGGKEGEVVVMGYKYPHYRASCMDCGYFISDDRTDKVVHHWNRRQFIPHQ